jgi:hypothetical protein
MLPSRDAERLPLRMYVSKNHLTYIVNAFEDDKSS